MSYTLPIDHTIAEDQLPENIVGIEKAVINANLKIPTFSMLLGVVTCCVSRTIHLQRQEAEVRIFPFGEKESEPIVLRLDVDPSISLSRGWSIIGIKIGKPEVTIENVDLSSSLEKLLALNFQNALEQPIIDAINSEIEKKTSSFWSNIFPTTRMEQESHETLVGKTKSTNLRV